MSHLGLYLACLIVPMVLGFWAQHSVKTTFKRYSEVPEDTGLTGAQVARRVLDANGLQDVPVNAVQGELSDHYDPKTRSVNLSEPVYGAATIASTAVAAHECGHAIQHAKAYFPMTVRSALWPVTAFASNVWMILLFAGALLGALNLVLVGVLLYAAVVLFQIVTLPVEFDASRRALKALEGQHLLTADELGGARRVLSAAALTYIAGFVASLGTLVYFFLASRD